MQIAKNNEVFEVSSKSCRDIMVVQPSLSKQVPARDSVKALCDNLNAPETSFNDSLVDSVDELMRTLSVKPQKRIQYFEPEIHPSDDVSSCEVLTHPHDNISKQLDSESAVRIGQSSINENQKEDLKDKASWYMQPFIDPPSSSSDETEREVHVDIVPTKPGVNRKIGYTPPSSDKDVEFKYYGFQRVAVRKGFA